MNAHDRHPDRPGHLGGRRRHGRLRQRQPRSRPSARPPPWAPARPIWPGSRAGAAGSRTSPATRSRPTSPGPSPWPPRPAGPRATCPTSPTPSTANGWGPVEKDRSNGEDGGRRRPAADPRRGRLRQGPRRPRRVGYPLHDERTAPLFTAKVGVDDEVGTKGTVVFQVWADGTKLYDSGTLTGSSPTATVSVDVTGRTALRLVVTKPTATTATTTPTGPTPS